jgi:thiamine-phosphate pyrophosphorylase
MNEEVLRILDVNINRAREALRVIEDYARFVLDDADAASAAKRQRHVLRGYVERIGGRALLGARDIDGDVGRETKTPAEGQRADAEDVVRAAFGRLSEAARGLSEYGKVIAATPAADADALRYAAYELEQRIVLRGGARARFRAVRLYVLMTERLCRRDWLQTAEATIRGGAGCLQLREKGLGDGEFLARARRLRELTKRHGVLLAINDRPDIARLAGADIVHVGQDDLTVRDVRRIAGTSLLIGKSTHTVAQLEAALAEEPDYVAVGPMFASDTKPQPHVAGAQLATEAAKRTQLPLVAVGGITTDNAADMIRAGASCVAVCSAVIGTDDPEAATRSILKQLETTS